MSNRRSTALEFSTCNSCGSTRQRSGAERVDRILLPSSSASAVLVGRILDRRDEIVALAGPPVDRRTLPAPAVPVLPGPV